MYFWDIYLDFKKRNKNLQNISNPDGIGMGETTPNVW